MYSSSSDLSKGNSLKPSWLDFALVSLSLTLPLALSKVLRPGLVSTLVLTLWLVSTLLLTLRLVSTLVSTLLLAWFERLLLYSLFFIL